MGEYFKVYVDKVDVYHELALHKICRVQTVNEPCNFYLVFCPEENMKESIDKIKEFDWVIKVDRPAMFKLVTHT